MLSLIPSAAVFVALLSLVGYIVAFGGLNVRAGAGCQPPVEIASPDGRKMVVIAEANCGWPLNLPFDVLPNPYVQLRSLPRVFGLGASAQVLSIYGVQEQIEVRWVGDSRLVILAPRVQVRGGELRWQDVVIELQCEDGRTN